MENNIVNLEDEFLKQRNKEALDSLLKKDFEKVKELLKEPIEKIDEKINGKKIYCPQNIFEATIFLNFLEPKAEQKDFAKINYYDFYLMMAASSYNLNEFEEAKKYYEKAIELNPASSVARLQLFEINKKEKKFDNFTEGVKEFFDYAYRRADISKAYRDVGYYLYEQKDFEMAIVAYYLSTVYELSDISMQEVRHIAEKENIDLDSKQWLSEEMMGEFYNKYKIPLLPNQKLVNLADVLANDAYEKKALRTAQFAYTVAYDLTLEEKYLDKVKELTEIK